MCNFALIGAVAPREKLREVLENAGNDFDTDVAPDAAALALFPAQNEVVCVTCGGCSCALLGGVGLSTRPRNEAHAAGPGYAFRRALAEMVLRFGEVQLLAFSAARAPTLATGLPERSTTLGNFLRFGLQSHDGLVRIVAG